jgi:hypothetical protein
MTNQNAAAFPLFVPVARVIDRIVKETMDAVEGVMAESVQNRTLRNSATEILGCIPDLCEFLR